MLTIQDLQFHPAVTKERKTAHDFVLDGGLGDLPGALLTRLAHEYLAFSNGRANDMCLFRALQCLEAAAAQGVDEAIDQLADLELAMGLV